MNGGNDNENGAKWWIRHVVVPLLVAIIGSGTIVIIVIPYIFSRSSETINTPATQVILVTQIMQVTELTEATKTVPELSIENNLLTQTLIQTINSCPIYEETGVGITREMPISVKMGEIAFIDTLIFDDMNNGVFATITGPYDGSHTLKDGAICNGIPADSNYQSIREQRRQGQNDVRAWDIAISPYTPGVNCMVGYAEFRELATIDDTKIYTRCPVGQVQYSIQVDDILNSIKLLCPNQPEKEIVY